LKPEQQVRARARGTRKRWSKDLELETQQNLQWRKKTFKVCWPKGSKNFVLLEVEQPVGARAASWSQSKSVRWSN